MIVIIVSTSFAQQRKGQLHLSNATQHDLHVSFGFNLLLNQSSYFQQLMESSSEFRSIVEHYHIDLQKDIQISEEHLLLMEENAIKLKGNSDAVRKLRNIFKVKIDNPTNSKLLEIGIALEKLDIVEYCCLTSLEPTRPPVDIPPTTSNFEPNQTYIQSNPGVNMQHA